MMGGHPQNCPDLVELAGLLGLGLSAKTEKLLTDTDETVDEILAWIDDCPHCTKGLATLESWQDEVGYPDLAVVANERNRALELWEELASVPTEELADRIGEEHCFWAMAALLPQKSVEAARNSSNRAVELAQLAVAILDLLDLAYYTPRLVRDLEARLWCYMGNAHRVSGSFKNAERAFEKAQDCLRKGTGALLAQATFFDLLGSLRKDQGLFKDAIEVLTYASELYEAAGQLRLIGKVYLMLGAVEEMRGNLEGGVAHFTAAQSLISPEREPRLFAVCQHALLGCLTSAGHFEEAEIRVPSLRTAWEDFGDSKSLLQLRWIEARIMHGLSRFERARALYLEVQEAFVRSDLLISVALVKLDLAALVVESGLEGDVKKLVTQAFEIFAESGAEQQALAALAFLAQEAEAAQVTESLMKSVIGFLRTGASRSSRWSAPPKKS